MQTFSLSIISAPLFVAHTLHSRLIVDSHCFYKRQTAVDFNVCAPVNSLFMFDPPFWAEQQECSCSYSPFLASMLSVPMQPSRWWEPVTLSCSTVSCVDESWHAKKSQIHDIYLLSQAGKQEVKSLLFHENEHWRRNMALMSGGTQRKRPLNALARRHCRLNSIDKHKAGGLFAGLTCTRGWIPKPQWGYQILCRGSAFGIAQRVIAVKSACLLNDCNPSSSVSRVIRVCGQWKLLDFFHGTNPTRHEMRLPALCRY